METTGMDLTIGRTFLETMFLRVFGESERSRAHGMNKRQLAEAILRKAAPGFNVEGRSGAALEAALAYVVETLPMPVPSTQRGPDYEEMRRGLVAELGVLEAQRRTIWQQPMSGAPAPPKLDLEAARVADATPVKRVDDFSHFAAEFAALEQKRRTAATPRARTAEQIVEDLRRR